MAGATSSTAAMSKSPLIDTLTGPAREVATSTLQNGSPISEPP